MSPRAGLDRHTLVIRAAEIADAEGIEAVTLAALAAKLGVRSPSLYNHINGLQDLRTGLAIYGLELLFTCMSNAAEGLNGDAAVHAMGRAYVDFARVDQACMRLHYEPLNRRTRSLKRLVSIFCSL